MNAIEWVDYRSHGTADSGFIAATGTSIQDEGRAEAWHRRLGPWLRAGGAGSCAYLNFGSEAAFIRFREPSVGAATWQTARALIASSRDLPADYALELPAEAAGGSPPGGRGPGPRRSQLEAQARDAAAATAIVPVLAHVLQGASRVTVPALEPLAAEAAMWGLNKIARLIGDQRPVSFLTSMSGPGRDGDIPGVLVSFRAHPAPVPPDLGFAALAADLAARFAADPAGLRTALDDCRVPLATDHNSRISRLLTLPPRSHPGSVHGGGTTTVTTSFGDRATPASSARPTAQVVMCPMCLGEIPNWSTLDYWRWDATESEYVKIDMPADLSIHQRARFTHKAFVRCPSSGDMTTVGHYLPAKYGQFGDPVLLGFVGLTESGKTHLLASMVSQIRKLGEIGVDIQPLDHGTHQQFMEKFVKPLIAGNKVLPGTRDQETTTLADAFIVRHGREERVVALFDVSGGNLVRGEQATEFLWIADGLFFVIDPGNIASSRAGDDSFASVLDILGGRAKAEPPCAAIVLNKADMARFEEPIARWLRAGNGKLDPTDFLRESADVYAYLERNEALELARPYSTSRKATFHVASPTGGAKERSDQAGLYPRGVTPQRVLRPLMAMLAMTGVITGQQAELIGV